MNTSSDWGASYGTVLLLWLHGGWRGGGWAFDVIGQDLDQAVPVIPRPMPKEAQNEEKKRGK